MKTSIYHRFLSFCILSLVGVLAFGQTEKKIQIFRNGEIVQEYLTSDIDYIEINDLVSAPEDVTASVSDNKITVVWNAVENATYSIFRSPDNVNFTLLASGLETTSYTDNAPLQGTNYYRIKAVVDGKESGYTASVGASLTDTTLESGIYLGITGFNQALYNYPTLRLAESSVGGFRNFIDGLSTKYGTLLYYSVDQALNSLQSAKLPSDVSSVALVTFTDGLDQGSMMMDVPYDNDMAYLDALNGRIKNETVSGKPITAFSIGVRGKDVSDIDMFSNNLSKLASSPENAMGVTSMAEVTAKFKEIAEMLSQSNYVQSINLKMPGISNGSVIRFTFDNVNSADKSTLYIEGTFNLKERLLENVKYVGLTSTSGATIKGTVDGIFVNFAFEGVHTDNNVLVKSEFTDEWTFIASNSSWQINSEFDKTEDSEIVTERSSAAIMLVLDCSSSLADDFIKVQNNAKDFINTLYQAVGGSDEPGGNETTVYSTVPADLSVAIWKDGARYYLTPEQYKNANLKNATVEGLTVLSNLGNFIISPYDLQWGGIYKEYANYYSDKLPDKDQAMVISARYSDINNVLNSLGWEAFLMGASQYYMTKTYYNSSYNYTIYLHNYTGGELYNGSRYGFVRGIRAIDENPIIWNDPRDQTLAVKKDGVRYFLSEPNEDLTQYDEVEGVVVVVGNQKFIVSLHDAQSGTVTKDVAMNLYSNILPDAVQAHVISMKYYEINKALTKFGGEPFSKKSGDYYMTKAAYNSSYNYTIYLNNYTGGQLYNDCRSGLIRGVKAFEDE